jgi:GDP-mannose 4,6 dehydratase
MSRPCDSCFQQDEPDDYVIATGQTHSVRELVEVAFRHAGLPDWEKLVKVDSRYMRPADVELLVGDASKDSDVSGWCPSVDFESLIARMVDHDLMAERRLTCQAITAQIVSSDTACGNAAVVVSQNAPAEDGYYVGTWPRPGGEPGA